MDLEDARDSARRKALRRREGQGFAILSYSGGSMGKAIDLASIAADRSAEVSDLIAAINGDPRRALWTSEFRTAVRGGKPLVGPRIEE